MSYIDDNFEPNHQEMGCPRSLTGIFNDIRLGVLILKKNPASIIYSNPQFSHLAKGKESIVLKKIFNDLVLHEEKSFNSDIEFDDNVVLGYTIHKLSENDHLVFLSDISYKRILFENIGENCFYDRLTLLIEEFVHELGNPLVSVSTALNVLNDSLETWDVEKKRDYILRSLAGIERLSKYVERMRDFTTVNDYIHRKNVYLKATLDDIFQQNEMLLDRCQIDADVDIDPSLMVCMDKEAFNRVLNQLILNTSEVLFHGGKIWMKTDEVNQFFVKLGYLNDGPPISPKIEKKIFMPFFTTKEKGAGIGLAVSSKLMTRMGGALKIESPDKGWGAKFVLYIPVKMEK